MPTAEELGAPRTATTAELKKFYEVWLRRKKRVRWVVKFPDRKFEDGGGCDIHDSAKTPIDWDQADMVWKIGNVYNSDPTERWGILYSKGDDGVWTLDEAPQLWLTAKGAELLPKDEPTT